MLTERHSIAHIGWLRAAVLGVNDGVVFTTSLTVAMLRPRRQRR
jgi:VIT1/CCC1 family predicted Fe2+/Mn2+ transporter